MQKIEILVIGTNEEILKVIVRLVNANPLWNATGCISVDEANAKILEESFDLILLGAGLSERVEQEMIQTVADVKPTVPVVKHYGGGSGLLFAEIYQAVDAKRPTV
jgi:DNA-binding NtrC family response regulator